MKTRRGVIRRSGKTKALHAYCSCQSHLAKNLQNTANFYIRNFRSGLKKELADRTDNENEVIRMHKMVVKSLYESLHVGM